MTSGPTLPGTHIERAVANVAEEGGKSLVSALRTMLQAWANRKAARNSAEAEEIRLDIANEGERRRQEKAIEARRQYELGEIDHQRALVLRGLGRTIDEIGHAQDRIEYVAARAIELNAADSDRDRERDVNQDWLRRFFRYAADVDEDQILEIFAQALSDSAIRDRPLLSPKALDTLRFLEAYSFDMFTFCADLIGTFEAVPRGFLERRAINAGQELDIPLLIEMGLLKTEAQAHYLAILGSFQASFSYDPSESSQIHVVRLTHAGRGIAGLVNHDHRRLSDPLTFQGSSVELARLQQDLGLDRAVARDLGKSLVAELASASNLQLILRRDGTTLHNARKNYDNVFGFPSDDGFDEVTRAFLAEFEDFDRNQLAAMLANTHKRL